MWAWRQKLNRHLNARLRKRVAAAPRRPVKVVLVSDMYRRGPVESLPRDVQGFVYGLMQCAGLSYEDFPREAVLSAAADFYLAEVSNGGHNGFLGNIESRPTTFEQISAGLDLVGLNDVAEIFAEMLAFQAEDPEHFRSTDWQDPVLQSLDDQLRPISNSAHQRHSDWLEKQPFIHIIPAKRYTWDAVLKAYLAGQLATSR